MSKGTAAEFLIKKLNQQRQRVLQSIVKSLPEHEYRRLCGMDEAFDYAIKLIEHTAAQVANDEELDDE